MTPSRLRPLLCILLALLLASATCAAANQPVRLPLPPDADAEQLLWYGIYLKNKKIGYARIRMGLDNSPSAPLYAVDMDLSIRTKSMGKDVMLKSGESMRFATTPPYSLLSGQATKGDGSSFSVRRAPDGALITRVRTQGKDSTMAVPAPDVSFLDYTTPRAWFASGPSKGDKLLINTFMLSSLTSGTELFTVKEKKRSMVDGVPTDYYVCRHDSTATGINGVRVVMDASGTMLSSVIGKNLELRKESEEQAWKLDLSTDLFVMGISRINRPIGNPSNLASLELKVRGDTAKQLASGPRQTVLPAPGGVKLLLGATHANRIKATDEDIRAALAQTPSYPVNDPVVEALAHRAVAGATTDAEKVKRLVAFVHGYLEKELRPMPVSPASLITDPRGDCTEHADFFTLLARAAGIPARPVSGLYYMGDEPRAFGGHAWNEVVLDGVWVEVDAVGNQLAPDPAHIRLEAGRRTGAAFFEHLGELQFTVLKAIPKKDAAGKAGAILPGTTPALSF